MAALTLACTSTEPEGSGAAGSSTGAGGDGIGATGVGGEAAASSSGGNAGVAGSAGDGGEANQEKAANCADAFGDQLTDSFGRLDGTVLAIVGPSDTQCALPNDDHLVIQVTMDGAVYRMVVNIDGVFLAEKSAALIGAAWDEGWHTDVMLDYTAALDAHSDDFVPHTMDELVTLVSAPIEIGAPISVYATSSGGTYASSAHLVHRNGGGADGAVVLDPMSDPKYLLFRFDNQQF